MKFDNIDKYPGLQFENINKDPGMIFENINLPDLGISKAFLVPGTMVPWSWKEMHMGIKSHKKLTVFLFFPSFY